VNGVTQLFEHSGAAKSLQEMRNCLVKIFKKKRFAHGFRLNDRSWLRPGFNPEDWSTQMNDLRGGRRRRVRRGKPRFGRSLTLPELRPTCAGPSRLNPPLILALMG
jgi:hypothetical protein